MKKNLDPEVAQMRAKKAVAEKEIFHKAWNDESINKTSHKVIIGDSSNMLNLKNDSVHLIVTSPPYFNARSYSNWENVEEYVLDMKKVFRECFRVLTPGRRFCLNISDLPEKGTSGVKWNPLGPLLLTACLQEGFELCDRVFWFKTPLKGFQYGSLPYPPSPLICDSIEYVYILRKPGKMSYDYASRIKKDASRLMREDYIEYTKQIWSIPRVRLAKNSEGHIAPFPDELVRRCIRLYSFVGDMVLDPFAGSGTVTKVAIETKRNSTLYEIKEEYLTHIKKKIAEVSNDLYSSTDVQYYRAEDSINACTLAEVG